MAIGAAYDLLTVAARRWRIDYFRGPLFYNDSVTFGQGVYGEGTAGFALAVTAVTCVNGKLRISERKFDRSACSPALCSTVSHWLAPRFAPGISIGVLWR